jgi:hypothetical protein
VSSSSSASEASAENSTSSGAKPAVGVASNESIVGGLFSLGAQSISPLSAK